MKSVGLFLGVKPSNGGMFQYCESILLAMSSLDKEKYKVNVIYTNQDWRKTLEDQKFDSIYINHNPNWNRFYKIGFSIGFFSVISKFFCRFDSCIKRIEALDCNIVIFPAQDIIAPLLKSPIGGTIHDLMHRYESQFPESGSFLRFRTRETYFKELVKKALLIFVDSRVGKEHVEESYDKQNSNIKILPYIAPRYIFDNSIDQEKIDSFKEKNGLPPKFIFYPAQLWGHKNHENLFKAVALLKKQIPHISLVLAGPKTHIFKRLLKLVDAFNLQSNIHFIGYVSQEEIICLYKSAVGMVMPTYYGPTNIPPLEAFALGCPVAVSNIYGMPEQVGKAALLFDPNSPEQISHAIEKIWFDKVLTQELIQNGYSKFMNWNQSQFDIVFEQHLASILF